MDLVKNGEKIREYAEKLSTNYIERPEYEEKLKKSLDKDKLAVLYGYSGIGKTQIVLNYVEKHKYKYKNIFFINANSYLAILSDYSSYLHLSQDISVRFRANDWFEKNKDWLLIYDGLDSDDIRKYFLKGYIVNSQNGDIIITSILNGWENSIDVKCFSKEESISFLEKETSIYDYKNALEIANLLGNYPFSLTIATEYINLNNISYFDFGILYKKQNEKILDLEIYFDFDFHRKVNITANLFKMIYLVIDEDKVLDFLGVFSYFSENFISIDLFETIYNRNLGNLVNVKTFRELIKLLVNYKVLIVNNENLKFNKIFQIIVRFLIKNNQNCLKNSIKIIYEYFESRYLKSKNLLNRYICVNHILSIAKYGILCNNEFNKSTYCFLKIAKLYALFGLNVKSENMYYEVLLMYKIKFGSDYIGIYDIYIDRAYIYIRKGEYDKADIFLEKTKNNYKELLGDHKDTLKIIEECIEIKLIRGLNNEAEILIDEGIEISKKIFLKRNLKILELRNKKALIMGLNGDIQKSLRLCNNILAKKQKIYGMNNIETYKSYNTLAKLYLMDGNYKNAEIMFKKVFKFIINQYGEKSEEIIGVYYNLGVLNMIAKDYVKAEIYLLKAVEVRLNSSYKYCYHSIVLYLNLAEIYCRQNRFLNGKEMVLKSLEIAEDVFEDNSFLADLYSYMAVIDKRLGNLEESRFCINKSIKIKRENKKNNNILNINGKIGLLDKL